MASALRRLRPNRACRRARRWSYRASGREGRCPPAKSRGQCSGPWWNGRACAGPCCPSRPDCRPAAWTRWRRRWSPHSRYAPRPASGWNSRRRRHRQNPAWARRRGRSWAAGCYREYCRTPYSRASKHWPGPPPTPAEPRAMFLRRHSSCHRRSGHRHRLDEWLH